MNSEINTSIDAVLGLILSNIRKNKKKSQDEAATFIGVTKQAISNMENGRSRFAVVQVYQLCAFYGVEPCKVFNALDEALKNKEVNVIGVAGGSLAFIGPRIVSKSSISTNNLTNIGALVHPIIAGVALAGFLGSLFMKKVKEASQDEHIE
ncbi:helix-turn-helix domain-containing protein [Acinetobacter kyonggiensis]|jgi:transcriptional regulator with XRE-family HTH domain|uniref:Helix-turn-helix n=1 Tax=Acinetobacter kyonggiensis TaxID=595670 RepID=A0A1H3MZB2_9GAMM|nr:helix-turn-helix transcriptional regulator [Acinetobacter kyonggiensis]SDY81982.1 Helix-turn-helix [Acinetobacter kyonggiensis]